MSVRLASTNYASLALLAHTKRLNSQEPSALRIQFRLLQTPIKSVTSCNGRTVALTSTQSKTCSATGTSG